jgi:hypothetical protein
VKLRLLILFIAALGIGFTTSVSAATGPTETPLKITAMYIKGGNGTIYVAFQSGAMPGCYANAGGYLYPTNTYYKEIYAQLLTMNATGGLQAAVIYTQNASTNNWSDCTIDGLFLTSP